MPLKMRKVHRPRHCLELTVYENTVIKTTFTSYLNNFTTWHSVVFVVPHDNKGP